MFNTTANMVLTNQDWEDLLYFIEKKNALLLSEMRPEVHGSLFVSG
jgi:hypothetical protein